MATNFPTSVDVLTNPVSNDSLNSPSHSAQHANANDAIEAIEGYLLTGAGAAGLVKLIPTGATNGTVAANGDVTIGNAVSSITVTNAFSATYENYKIVVSGGVASADTTMSITLGAAVTGYYGSLIYAPYTTGVVAGATDNNANRFTYVGGGTTSTLTANFDLINPFLTKTTQLLTNHTRASATSYSGNYGGFLNNSTSFTDINILAASGTFTGGTIRIYGYK